MRNTNPEFYYSVAWKRTRKEVWYKQHCICNRCGKPVYVDGISEWLPKEKRNKGIVHHKEYLNNNNVMDDNIALNIHNLEGICESCHNKEHKATEVLRKGYDFDEDGNLIKG